MVSLAIYSLATCGGCESVLLSSKVLIDLLLRHNLEIKYFTMAVDEVKPPSTDISIVLGSLRSSRDIELVKEIRSMSSYVISLGTCSCYGGISGLLNFYDVNEVLKDIFKDIMPSKSLGAPTNLTNEVVPLDHIIKVDYYLPGCPPPLELIDEILTSLISGREFELPTHNVCSECPRNVGERVIRVNLRRRLTSLTDLDPNKCFLEQGILCLGPITRGGCKARCVRAGFWCCGCMGPLPGHRFDEDLIDLIASLMPNITPDYISKVLPDIVKITYKFVPIVKKVLGHG